MKYFFVLIFLFSTAETIYATCGSVYSNGTAISGGWYCGDHLIEGGTTYCNYWYIQDGSGDQYQSYECSVTCVRSQHSPGLDSCTSEGTCFGLATGVYCGSDPRVKGISNALYFCDASQQKPLYAQPCAGNGAICVSTGTGNDYCK